MFHPEGPTLRELIEQALSSTELGYDLLAPKFDRTPFRTPETVLESVRGYLRTHIAPKRLLDIACGTGALFDEPVAMRVVGVDFSAGMLRVARRAHPRATFIRAQALRLPFRGGFDAVTCFGALGHFRPRDHDGLVRAVRDCLVPDGHFLFVTALRPSRASSAYWRGRAFNTAMHLRNALWRPPFVMFYLTFLLPEATALLERRGFRVHVVANLPGSLLLVDAQLVARRTWESLDHRP